MRRALAACAFLAAACAHQGVRFTDDAASLIEAERAFAAESVRSDMRAAFLANFAADGVFLREGWANARAALGGRPAPPITLDWAPGHVEVARSGDLGLSTGPWIRTSRVQPGAPAAHGHFVSIWRRQEGGAWKVEADLGISHEAAQPLDQGVEVVEAPAATPLDPPLADAEARFVEASLRRGSREAYAAHALPRMLLYREAHVPLRGRAAALDSPAVGGERTLWLADRVAVSRAHDFGYVRGSYADAAEPTRVRGHFLRVWRREAGAWGIALDVAQPAR